MHPSQRIVNRIDRLRLYDAIFGLPLTHAHAAAVRELLAWATAVLPNAVPHDTVTMNSTVRLRNLTTGCRSTRSLVYPHDAASAVHGLSVLTALGSAMLARRIGEIVPWHGVDGTSQVIIDALEYQPEREGDYER